jgi:ATP-dependent DNA helicase RecG
MPAFANSAGGDLLFGVSDEGVVVGLIEDVVAAIARLNNLIHDIVEPVPNFRIESHDIGGKPIIVVDVQPGADRPYGLFRDPPQLYVRHGATSFHATREEIILLSARPDSRSSLR